MFVFTCISSFELFTTNRRSEIHMEIGIMFGENRQKVRDLCDNQYHAQGKQTEGRRSMWQSVSCSGKIDRRSEIHVIISIMFRENRQKVRDPCDNQYHAQEK